MPNKKQSARPVEAGWLLEVGVIGIDKTLKIIRRTNLTLLGVEWLFRGMKDYPRFIRGEDPGVLLRQHKDLLPWRKIPQPSQREREWIPYAGLLLGFESRQKANKGSKNKLQPREKPHRRPLMDWRLSKEDALLVCSPEVARLIDPTKAGRGRDLKKRKRIKAVSEILMDAILVLSGKRPNLRSVYSDEAEKSLRSIAGCRLKVQKIITESRALESRTLVRRKP